MIWLLFAVYIFGVFNSILSGLRFTENDINNEKCMPFFFQIDLVIVVNCLYKRGLWVKTKTEWKA